MIESKSSKKMIILLEKGYTDSRTCDSLGWIDYKCEQYLIEKIAKY
jgi:hypothetical protein